MNTRDSLHRLDQRPVSPFYLDGTPVVLSHGDGLPFIPVWDDTTEQEAREYCEYHLGATPFEALGFMLCDVGRADFDRWASIELRRNPVLDREQTTSRL